MQLLLAVGSFGSIASTEVHALSRMVPVTPWKIADQTAAVTLRDLRRRCASMGRGEVSSSASGRSVATHSVQPAGCDSVIKLRHGVFGSWVQVFEQSHAVSGLDGWVIGGFGLMYWRCVPAIAFAQWLIMAHLELHDL